MRLNFTAIRPEIKISAEVVDSNVKFAIKNNGIGISQSILSAFCGFSEAAYMSNIQ